MALTANTLPSVVPAFVQPRDAQNEFNSGETLTATGYFGAGKQLDLGGGAGLTAGAGRILGLWALDISAIDFTTGDETYRLFLLGSNDVAWANGNVEILAVKDFAKTANRLVPTIAGDSPAIPPAGNAATLMAVPFSNLVQGIVYRYVRGYLVAGGTTPSLTLSSWLSPDPT